MHDSKLEARKNNFQKVNVEILETRQNFKLSLRKKKIDEMITKKRLISLVKFDRKEYEIDVNKLNVNPEIKQKEFSSLEEFFLFVRDLLIQDVEAQIDNIKLGIYLLRSHLTNSKSILTDKTLKEIVNCMSNIISKKITDEIIIYEILWCFVNLSCAENHELSNFFLSDKLLLNYIDIFSHYESKNPILMEHVIWHCGNLLTDSTEARDTIIRAGLFERLSNLLCVDSILEGVVKTSVWVICLSLKCKPEMEELRVLSSTRVALKFLKTNDQEVENDCLWGLSFASETNFQSVIKTIMDSDICSYIFNSDRMKQRNLVVPSVRVLGNLLSNDPVTADRLIEAGCIAYLENFLLHKLGNVRKETLWSFSNIAAGDLSQIKALFEAHVVEKFFYMLKDNDFEVVREAVYAISNIVNGGNFEICLKLVELKLLDAIYFILRTYKDTETIRITLQMIKTFLDQGANSNYMSDINPFVKLFEDSEGCRILEDMQYHKNSDIYELTSYLLERYFNIQLVTN